MKLGRGAVASAKVLWAPSEAMAKLWETMKTLEGSAENRDAKIEETRAVWTLMTRRLVNGDVIQVG